MIANRLPIVSLLMLATVAGMAWWALIYRGVTFEFGEEEAVASWLALFLVPVAMSWLIALTPAIRGSWKATAAVCSCIGLLLFAFVLSKAEPFDAQAFGGASLVSILPASGLFVAARSPEAQRWPWILLMLGPVSYLLGIFVAFFIAFAILEHRVS